MSMARRMAIEQLEMGMWRKEGRINAVHKIRIEINKSGGYSVMDVTGGMAQEDVSELPAELRDKLSLMLLLAVDTEMDGLGYRYSDTVFYVNGD